jgi:hypothetical protein
MDSPARKSTRKLKVAVEVMQKIRKRRREGATIEEGKEAKPHAG